MCTHNRVVEKTIHAHACSHTFMHTQTMRESEVKKKKKLGSERKIRIR